MSKFIKLYQYIDNQIAWLKSYLDAEVSALRRAVDKVETTNSKAVDKVEINNTAKFEAQNEWRSQYKDQTATFVTRRELEIIKEQIGTYVTRGQLWGAAISLITLMIATIAIILRK